MDITITPKKVEGVERLLGVSVPAAALKDAEEKAARRYATQVRLPGFRPGKAPAAMVRKRFADAIRQEAVESVVQDAFKEVLEREKLQPITQPHIHDLKVGGGDEPTTFELHVEVRPDLALERTGGFSVTRPAAEVTDEMVVEQIEALREQRAVWSPSDDRPMPGDQVTVQLASADEGGELPEGREYKLQLGATPPQAIEGIEALIMEATPGETLERPVKWPDDFADEAQRGRTKTVRVALTEVKRRALPDLDDAFAREIGDFDSLDALRAAVREDMTRHGQRESEAEVRRQLVDQIVEANPFDVPPSWVAQLVKAYGDGYQIPEQDRPAFESQFREMAERQVRRDMVIDAVAEKEGLAATEAELDERVAELARERKMDAGKVYAQLQKAGRLQEMERTLTEDKVFAHLLAQSTVA